MPFPLEHPADGDWTTLQRNTDAIAARLNPVLPQARVFNSANISIPNSAVTVVTFDSERFDEGGMHALGAGRLTAPITGLYLIGADVRLAANATGIRAAHIRLNNVTDLVDASDDDPGAAQPVDLTMITLYRLTAGDYVEVTVFQNSGGALNVLTNANTSPEFWMVRLGGFTQMGV